LRAVLLALVALSLAPASKADILNSAEPAAYTDQCLEDHAVGQEARLEGKFTPAMQSFERCSRSECPELVRTDCSLWLSEVRQLQPSVQLEFESGVDSSQVRVFANGKQVFAGAEGRWVFDPGRLQLRVTTPGRAAQEYELVLRAGEPPVHVSVKFPTDAGAAQSFTSRPSLSTASSNPPPSKQLPQQPVVRTRAVPLLSFVLGGTAVVTAGAAALLGWSSLRERKELEQDCAPLCPASRVDALAQRALWSDVATGVSLASATAALVLYFGRDFETAEAHARPAGSAWNLKLAQGDVAFSWKGRF
jgi:hypothetical protein